MIVPGGFNIMLYEPKYKKGSAANAKPSAMKAAPAKAKSKPVKKAPKPVAKAKPKKKKK